MDPTPLVAGIMGALGIVVIFRPKPFGDIYAYVRRTFASATPERAQRLERVLDARAAAEAGSSPYLRLAGGIALSMAASVFALHVPILTAFGAACFSIAVIVTLAYGQFRRPSERRAATLTRRAPLFALSPVVIAYAVLCSYGGFQLLEFAQWRVGVVALLAAEAIVLLLAWRIAAAPARLLGEDPEVENLVDERVRYCRANLIAFSAAIPLYAVLTMTGWYAPHSEYYSAFRFAVDVGFSVTVISLVLPMWKPLALR
jgi:hypothetical protein